MDTNKSNKIPDEIAQEVIELASKLYAEAQKNNEGYSLSELQDIGNQVSIPDEIMEEALTQIQAKYADKKNQEKKFKEQLKLLTWIGSGIGLLTFLWGIITYNSLINNQQKVESAWAQVENQLQRKADLIPNLINVVKTQTNYQKELITLLTNAHQQYLSANTIEQKINSEEQISEVLSQVNNYILKNDSLSSSQAFTNLQYEIAGTENRIATERKRYNETVQKYNQTVKSFPNSIIANVTGFKQQPFFQSSTNK